MIRDILTRKDVEVGTVEEWNMDSKNQRRKERGLAEVKWKRDPPIWAAKAIKGEATRRLIKWHIGRFPRPRKGAAMNKTVNASLAQLTECQKEWSREKQRRVESLTNELNKSTLFALEVGQVHH